MYYNPNKAVSANSHGIKIFYADSSKSYSMNYETGCPLGDIQIRGKSKEISNKKTSKTQKDLYNQAMYGLKSFSPSELKKLPYTQKMEVKEKYEKTQYYLNIWKQELVHQKIGSFLTTIFHRSEFASKLAFYPKSINPWERSNFTLKDLGVRKEMIEEKLIRLKILPENYYQLSI